MFKVKNNSIKLGQEAIKVVTKTGTNFVPGNILRFEIPKGLGFINFKDSYLEAEVEIGAPNQDAVNSYQPCMMFDPTAGSNLIIERMVIRSNGVLIEELNGYDIYANLHHNATKSEGNENKRTLLEGCAKSLLIQDNPWSSQNSAIQAEAAPASGAGSGLDTASKCWKQNIRKVCLPLLGGLFNSEQQVPVFELGLEVEIILNPALKILRTVEMRDGANLDQLACDDMAAGLGQLDSVIVSQRALFDSMGGGTAASIQDPNVNVNGEQNINSACNLPLRVGQVVRVECAGADATPGNKKIGFIKRYDAAAGVNAGKLQIFFVADAGLGLTQFISVTPRTAPVTGISVHCLQADGSPLAQHGTIGYQVHEPRLVLQKVIPSPDKAAMVANGIRKGNFSINLNSWIDVNTSIPASQTTSTNQIAVDLSRVKSILSVPTSQSNTENLLYANGINGLYLDSSRYIYNIKNKFRPDRHVSLTREQYPLALRAQGADEIARPYKLGNHASGFHMFEVEKALIAAGMDLKNLNFVTKNNSQDHRFLAVDNGCWLVGRSLASQVNASTNIMGQSVLLYLDYLSSSNMVKLVHHFCVHTRSILFEGLNGISVSY